jgi:hypothetical protein
VLHCETDSWLLHKGREEDTKLHKDVPIKFSA